MYKNFFRVYSPLWQIVVPGCVCQTAPAEAVLFLVLFSVVSIENLCQISLWCQLIFYVWPEALGCRGFCLGTGRRKTSFWVMHSIPGSSHFSELSGNEHPWSWVVSPVMRRRAAHNAGKTFTCISLAQKEYFTFHLGGQNLDLGTKHCQHLSTRCLVSRKWPWNCLASTSCKFKRGSDNCRMWQMGIKYTEF